MMEKAVEQIQNSISGLKEMECALLGNIYKCRERIPKEKRKPSEHRTNCKKNQGKEHVSTS